MSSEKENLEQEKPNQNQFDESNSKMKSDEKESQTESKEELKEPEVELSPEEKLKKDLEEKNKEIESLKDRMLRQQAQLSNDRKRFKQDAELSSFETKKRLLKKVLDIRDNIDRALSSFNLEDESQKVHYDGIKIIASQFDDMLDLEGIKELESKGEMYDLVKHEIVARVPYDGPENRVIDVIQKGYTMNGKLLRTAKVAISMKKQPIEKIKKEETQNNETKTEETMSSETTN
jgi:molecular chaperone GrpE